MRKVTFCGLKKTRGFPIPYTSLNNQSAFQRKLSHLKSFSAAILIFESFWPVHQRELILHSHSIPAAGHPETLSPLSTPKWTNQRRHVKIMISPGLNSGAEFAARILWQPSPIYTLKKPPRWLLPFRRQQCDTHCPKGRVKFCAPDVQAPFALSEHCQLIGSCAISVERRIAFWGCSDCAGAVRPPRRQNTSTCGLNSIAKTPTRSNSNRIFI